MAAELLTADEQTELIGVLADLAEQGEHETAQSLADLAHDPDAVRAVLHGLKSGDAADTADE
jgi:hypothetical protein